jgi:hypothetical protein
MTKMKLSFEKKSFENLGDILSWTKLFKGHKFLNQLSAV